MTDQAKIEALIQALDDIASKANTAASMCDNDGRAEGFRIIENTALSALSGLSPSAVAPLIEAQVSAEIETLCAERDELNRSIFGLFDTCAKYRADLAQARAAAIEEALEAAQFEGANEQAIRRIGGLLHGKQIAKNANCSDVRAAAIEEAARVALSYGTDLRNHDAVRTAGAAIAAAILALASRPVSERESDTAPAPAISGGETREALIHARLDLNAVLPMLEQRGRFAHGVRGTLKKIDAALAAADRSATPPASGKTQDEVFRAEGEEA